MKYIIMKYIIHNDVFHICTEGGLMSEPTHWHVNVLFLLKESAGTQMSVKKKKQKPICQQ